MLRLGFGGREIVLNGKWMLVCQHKLHLLLRLLRECMEPEENIALWDP